MLVSLTIGSLLVVSAVSATRALTGTRATVDQRMERTIAARQAIDGVVTALRNIRRDPIEGQSLVVGTSGGANASNDRIDLLVTSDRRCRDDGAESDQYEVSFELGPMPGSPLPALMCRKDHAFDDQADKGGLVTVVAENIVGLSFEYLAGEDWMNEWPALSTEMPEAVRVTVQAVNPPTRAGGGPTPPRMEVSTLSTVVPIRITQEPTQRPRRSDEEPSAGGPPRE